MWFRTRGVGYVRGCRKNNQRLEERKSSAPKVQDQMELLAPYPAKGKLEASKHISC